jgi:hypothetical protein
LEHGLLLKAEVAVEGGVIQGVLVGRVLRVVQKVREADELFVALLQPDFVVMVGKGAIIT